MYILTALRLLKTTLRSSTVSFIFQVVNALMFLKTNLNVIHRDVKPSNILVNRAGEIKLCDYGVSGYLENSLAMTRVGCKFYMSVGAMMRPLMHILDEKLNFFSFHLLLYDAPFAYDPLPTV